MGTPTLNRRDVLKLSAAGTAAMAIPLTATLSAGTASTLPANRMPVPYTAAFKAPPVLEPYTKDDIRDDVYGFVPADYVPSPGSEHYPGEPIRGSEYLGTDYYRITETNVQAQVVPGMWTKFWCYAGIQRSATGGETVVKSVPGPTIRTYLQPDPDNPGKKIPRRTVMQVVNDLPPLHPTLRYVPWTSLHLHGSPSKPQFDGYAGDLSNPGEWKDYEYPNNCSPRTLWYHDHGVHHTAQNVYMGLAAQYHIVDRELEAALQIPQYDPTKPVVGPGQYEAPLILSDVILNSEGQLLWNDDGESGVYGDVVLVNGVPWPNMKVEPRKYRFRILNGSLARGYKLRLSNNMPFKVIATDGGFMQFAQTVTTLTIGMAERYEIIVDFSSLRPASNTAPTTKVQLVNDGVANARDFDHTGKIMQFEVGYRVTSTANNAWPTQLTAPHPVMTLQAGSRSAVRHMRLHRSNGMWKINDTTWEDVVASGYRNLFANPARGAIEIWDVENSSGGWFHPLHIHLVDFKVLSRTVEGVVGPPRPEEKGPKDVVYVGEEETVRLLMRFEHEDGRYMIHCHNLSHEDHDMMFQYQVGHHDIDCDAINSSPPRPLPVVLPVPKTEPVQAPPPPGLTDSSGSSGSGSSGSSDSSGTSGSSGTSDTQVTGGSTPTTPTTPTEPVPTGTESTSGTGTSGTTGGGA